MFETLLSESLSDLVINYLYYLLLTCHICLFVELSPLQKNPASKFNYFLASSVSAVAPFLITNTITFSSELMKNSAGIAAGAIASFITILTIQRIINID